MITILESLYEENALDEAVKRARNDLASDSTDKVLFLVPEQFTLETEKLLIDKMKTPGLIDIEVLSIKRLCTRILSKAKSELPDTLDSGGKSMIIKLISDKLKKELICFNNFTNKYSFNENLNGLFSELKKNNISPEVFNNEDINSLPETDYLLHKSKDIYALYSKYNEYLKNSYMDSDDLPLLAADYLDKIKFLDNTAIYYFGFYGFDKNIYALIQSFMDKNLNQTFIFTSDKSTYGKHDAFEIVDNTIKSILSISESKSEEVVSSKEIDPKNGINDDIYFLSKNIFSYDMRAYDKDKGSHNINILRASNIYEEVEWTAAEITRLLREENASFDEILVLPSDYDSYAHIISDTFSKYNLNFYIDNKTTILKTNIIQALIKIIDIISGDFASTDIISFLKTGMTEMSEENIQLLENYALELGIKGTMWLSDFTRNNNEEYYNLDKLNREKNVFLSPIISLYEKLKTETSPQIFSKELFYFLEEYGFNKKIHSYIDKFKEDANYEQTNRYAQIYNHIIKTIEQIHEYFAEETMSPKEFGTLLKYSFSATEIGLIPATLDSINVGTLSRSRSAKVSYLFMLGLNDEKILSTSSDTGIFSDEEKKYAKEYLGIDFRITSDYQLKEEKYFINSLLYKVRKKLYFSYPLISASGDELTASSIIPRVKTLMNIDEIVLNYKDTKTLLNLVANYDSTFKHLIRNYSMIKYNDPAISKGEVAFWSAVYNEYKNNSESKALAEIMESALTFENKAFISNKKLLNKLYDDKTFTTSISRLERQISCPFSYFLQYTLAIKERKELKLNPLDTGNIVHKIINTFSKSIISGEINTKKINQSELHALAKEIASKEIEHYNKGKFKKIVSKEYFKRGLISEVAFCFESIVNQLNLSQFTLTATETDFAAASSTPLKINLEDGKEGKITGKIDRIDKYKSADRDYVNVVDYKTGSKSFNLAEVYHGISLQLPIYLACAAGDDNTSPAGAFYFKINRPVTKLEKLSSKEEINKLLRDNNRLDGITANDVTIAEKIDTSINEQTSFVKQINLTRSNTLRKNDNILEKDEFSAVIAHSKKKAENAANEILSANIEVNPYKFDKETPCKYCKYNGICQIKLDPVQAKNSTRLLPKMNKATIMERLNIEREEKK